MGLFSEKLKYFRKLEKLSQRQAAAELGVSLRTLQDWEQDRTSPTLNDENFSAFQRVVLRVEAAEKAAKRK